MDVIAIGEMATSILNVLAHRRRINEAHIFQTGLIHTGYSKGLCIDSVHYYMLNLPTKNSGGRYNGLCCYQAIKRLNKIDLTPQTILIAGLGEEITEEIIGLFNPRFVSLGIKAHVFAAFPAKFEGAAPNARAIKLIDSINIRTDLKKYSAQDFIESNSGTGSVQEVLDNTFPNYIANDIVKLYDMWERPYE